MSLPDSLRWARRYLPDYFSDPPAPFHAELMADLEHPAARLIARIAPRGHAKSTCASFAYPLWCVCERRKLNIAIITHESSLAKQFVRDIREELATNERIREKYGDLTAEAADEDETDDAPAGTKIGAAKKATARKKKKTTARGRQKWTEIKFTLANGVTVQAKGSGASLRGVRVGPRRPDLIICDDIEKDDLVESAEGRRKLEHWLRRVVIPALAPDGQLLLLGSLIHYDSLLANLRDPRRFPKWSYKIYRAIECERRADGEFYRVALWPARWPLEKLDEERERVGPRAFEQEYQANPVDETIRAFPPEWLRRYDPAAIEPERMTKLMAVDPATGADGGDYFALWVGGVDSETGHIYTLELTLERIGIVEQMDRVVAAYERWAPVKIGIETTAYQVALKQMLDDLSRRKKLYMPIFPIESKKHKITRILASTAQYANGTFLLPPALAPEIEEQFLHFPKAKHDDAPDVCAMGIDLARTMANTLGFDGLATRTTTRSRRQDW